MALDPRDAFCGGRTNAVKLYNCDDVENGEELRYYDFTSLHPWVSKNGQYPFGHPEISSQRGHTDIDEYSGLIKCTVLLPEKLYHPFLPLRQHGKLTFPLCATCVEEEITETMLDPDGSMELPETSDGPFRDCVKAWLKIKEEASGRPLSC